MSNTTAPVPESTDHPKDDLTDDWALVIAWSVEKDRIGEIMFLAEEERATLGRSGDVTDPPRARFFRQRPGELVPTPPLEAPAISRSQLVLHARSFGIIAEVKGACPTFFNGKQEQRSILGLRDTISFQKQMLLQVVKRPRAMLELEHFAQSHWGPFGDPNAFGLVGESPAFWAALDQLALAAAMGTHVLLLGPTGSGKELAARAIHSLSARAKGPFVADNAAAITASLAEAELFGNIRGYPNAGQAERPGLVGEATGGTLFLDEIGRLSHAEQAKLLRALEGEYRRLGESKARRADFRLVAATNEPESALRDDFRRRFTVVVHLPSLDSRREDVSLLVRHLMSLGLKKGNALARDPEAPEGVVRPRPVRQSWMNRLLRRTYPGNIRELDEQIWKAVRGLAEDPLPVVEGAKAKGKTPPPMGVAALDKGAVEVMLALENGDTKEVARQFGVTRDSLRWFMRAEGIAEIPRGRKRGG